MNLKYLRTLRTILEAGSFQKAAARLNYTQSTVTFQMRQLETELSVKLFEKIGRRMALTDAGKNLLPHVDAVLESVDRLCHYGRDISEASGALNVATPETMLTYKMQPVLESFRRQAPRTKLLIRTQNCRRTREQILSGEIDIAIHYDLGDRHPAIVSECLAEYEQVLVASPLLPPERRDFKTPGTAKALTLISNDRNCISQEIFDRYLREKNIVLESAIELWSIEAIKKSVQSDLGIAYLPRFTVERELRDGRLIALPLPLRQHRIAAVCAYHRNRWLSPAMALFLNLSRKHLGQSPPQKRAKPRECGVTDNAPAP